MSKLLADDKFRLKSSEEAVSRQERSSIDRNLKNSNFTQITCMVTKCKSPNSGIIGDLFNSGSKSLMCVLVMNFLKNLIKNCSILLKDNCKEELHKIINKINAGLKKGNSRKSSVNNSSSILQVVLRSSYLNKDSIYSPTNLNEVNREDKNNSRSLIANFIILEFPYFLTKR